MKEGSKSKEADPCLFYSYPCLSVFICVHLWLIPFYKTWREKQGHGSRTQPRRSRRRPNARAMRGGRNACTSSRPRAPDSRRAASCSARNLCQRCSRRACSGIVKHVSFRRKPQQDRHLYARRISALAGFLARPRARALRQTSGCRDPAAGKPKPCAACMRRSASRSAGMYSRISKGVGSTSFSLRAFDFCRIPEKSRRLKPTLLVATVHLIAETCKHAGRTTRLPQNHRPGAALRSLAKS